jgi:hypothetical protein
MYKTTKSPRKVLLVAHLVAQEALPMYSHPCSPKTFTQHQIFAILALKEHQRCDYRKITALLKDSPDLRRVIGLEKVPHYTTIQKASARLLKLSLAGALLKSTLKLARKKSC